MTDQTRAGPGMTRMRWQTGHGDRWLAAGVFTLAVVLRVAMVLRSEAGYAGNFGYDASVYYAASAGLVNGRLPYRDFLLLHPPGVPLAISPFALIGSLTSDHIGFEVANIGAAALSALNCVLVLVIARRLGLTRGAQLSAALFYAVWFNNVAAEYLVRLEPFGNFFFLCGILTLIVARERDSRIHFVAAGAALTMAVNCKLWWAVAVAVLVGSVLVVDRSLRRVLLLGAGAAISGVLTVLPFFLAAPGAFWYMTVQAQSGRPRWHGYVLDRLHQSLTMALPGPGTASGALAVAVVLLVVAGLSVLAWVRAPTTRVFVVIFWAQLALLLAAPPFFTYYSDFLTVALALTIGGAVHALSGAPGRALAGRSPAGRSPAGRALAFVPIALVIAQTTVVMANASGGIVGPFPGRVELAAAARPLSCVMSDSPLALIQTDTLSRSFADGCANWVDVLARTYGAGNRSNRVTPGTFNPVWASDLYRYLMQGDGVILMQPGNSHYLKRADLERLEELRILAPGGGMYPLREVPEPPAAGLANPQP